jgi:outer membrane protein OmpA-like peptidoglycan-associated protein
MPEAAPMSRASRLKPLLGLCLSIAVIAVLSTPALAQREFQQPKPIQKPGEFQVPKGTWQTPGEFQVPRGIQAIKSEAEQCRRKLSVVADALFEFNQATLTSRAEETLNALPPMLAQAGRHPVSIEGHTDSIGSADYNQTLSEQRAQAVKGWLVSRQAVPAATAIKGYGKTRPVASNTKPDGSDNPEGRQKNRRVEILIDTCR